MGPAPAQSPAPAPAPAPEQAGDRNITIKAIILMAEKCGKSDIINANGYNGHTWDELTDEQITKLKLWIVNVSKKAGAA